MTKPVMAFQAHVLLMINYKLSCTVCLVLDHGRHRPLIEISMINDTLGR